MKHRHTTGLLGAALLTLSGCRWFDSGPGLCATYAQTLSRPAVQDLLENWFRQFPRTVAASERLRNRTTIGYGYYYRPLEFDPALIGMGPRAHAQYSVDGKDRVGSLMIVETAGAAYIFAVDGEAFHSGTLRSPRTPHVGVLCLTRETVD